MLLKYFMLNLVFAKNLQRLLKGFKTFSLTKMLLFLTCQNFGLNQNSKTVFEKCSKQKKNVGRSFWAKFPSLAQPQPASLLPSSPLDRPSEARTPSHRDRSSSSLEREDSDRSSPPHRTIPSLRSMLGRTGAPPRYKPRRRSPEP
jgi:hypothetical protein